MNISKSKDVKMSEEGGNLLGRYNRSAIKKITFNDFPFLLTGEALVFGKSFGDFSKIITTSTVGEDDCKGHFGSLDRENLKIPLLHLSRVMIIAAQIIARLVCPDKIPILVNTENVRANNQNLIPPPATITSRAIDFIFHGHDFYARAFAQANGEPYAEIKKLCFKLIGENEFKRINCVRSKVPNNLLDGCRIKEEMYYTDIERLILEREPFHRLDKAIFVESSNGDLKLITISKIYQEDCIGQMMIDNKLTILPIDYAKVMALTAELLASIVTRQRFNNFSVVPIAVRVDKVDTSNLLFFSPPATIIAEAIISKENLYNRNMIKRGKEIFWANSVRALVDDNEMASMDNITYALIPENEF